MHNDSDDNEALSADALAALFAALAPITPPPGLEAKLRERIATLRTTAPHTTEPRAVEPQTTPADSALNAAGLVTIRADAGAWRTVAPGVRIKSLGTESNTQVRSLLVELDAGATLPAHNHAVAEECLVLRGAVALGDVVVHAGDYHLAPAGVPHGRVHSAEGVLMFVRGDFSEFE